MCRVGVSNAGRCSSIVIGPSQECKRVGNKVCAMPWCHGTRNFELKKKVGFEPCLRTIVVTAKENLQRKRALLRVDFQCVNQYYNAARS